MEINHLLIDENIAKQRAFLGVSDQKWKEMLLGLVTFKKWLDDVGLLGLVVLESKELNSIERMAQILTDHKLSTPAAILRQCLKTVNQSQWYTQMTYEIGYWHLFFKALAKSPSLSADDINALILQLGHKVKEAWVLENGTVLNDHWYCIGQENGNEDAIYHQYTYWMGGQFQRFAVQRRYNFGSPPTLNPISLGTNGTIGLVAYPGNLPGRVQHPARMKYTNVLKRPNTFRTFKEQRIAQIKLLKQKPWLREIPIAIGPITVQKIENNVYLVDQDNQSFLLGSTMSDAVALQISLIAGSSFCWIFGKINMGFPKILSIWYENQFISL